MDEEKDILSEKLRSQLKEYHHPVKKDIWSRIEKDLPEQPVKKKIPLYPILSGVAGVILLIGIGLFFINENPDREIIAGNENYPTTPEADASLSVSSFSGDNDEMNLAPDVFQQKDFSEEKGSVIKKVPEPVISATIEQQEERETENLFPDSSPGEEKNRTERPVDKYKSGEDSYETWKSENSGYPIFPPLKNRQTLSFGLALGNSGFSSTNSNYKQFYAYNLDMVESIHTDVKEFVKETSGVREANRDIEYKLPFSVGVTVRKHLTDQWALESGIIYTHLVSSETEKSSGIQVYKKDIKLNYIGIPLKGIYSFYETPNLSLYISGGGMLEKSVSGKEISFGGISRSLNISEIQASVFTNIGLNVKLIDHWGVFLEPGLVYYFDDGSNIETIRKDRPFNFNLQAGIRVTY